MGVVRINISLQEELFAELAREIGPRQRSRFISKAVEHFLEQERARRLAAEYEEAAAEIRRVNADLEGVIADGLD